MVYDDATQGPAVERAEAVDVWSATFECGPNSGQDRRPGGEERREENVGRLRKALGYVKRMIREGTPPKVLMLENTWNMDRLHAGDTAKEVDRALLELRGYLWRRGALCPTRHSGMPNARKRIYWLAVWGAARETA